MASFLYNNIDPGCPTAPNPRYQVTDDPVLIQVAGLLPGQSLPIEMEISGVCSVPCGVAGMSESVMDGTGQQKMIGVQVELWARVA